MFHLLVDTCVWLDLARDPVGGPLLDVVEELIRRKQLSLIVPRIVVVEFARNKKKVSEAGEQSLTTAFKRVKEAVWAFDEPKRKRHLLQRLNDVDAKLPTIGDAAVQTVGRIDRLLAQSAIIEATDNLKAKAAQRAMDGSAPFHRGKNSIGDALLIETYAECIRRKNPGVRFGFVTHNKHDFSAANGDHRVPVATGQFEGHFQRCSGEPVIHPATGHVAPSLS